MQTKPLDGGMEVSGMANRIWEILDETSSCKGRGSPHVLCLPDLSLDLL